LLFDTATSPGKQRGNMTPPLLPHQFQGCQKRYQHSLKTFVKQENLFLFDMQNGNPLAFDE
jgi:hypothetical protein